MPLCPAKSPMPAAARQPLPNRAAGRPVPGARLPMLHVGQAREFRRHIALAHTCWLDAADALIAPLRPVPGMVKMPRHARLQMIADAFEALPAAGRLCQIASFVRPKLTIAEVRLTASKLRLPAWDGDYEPALSIRLFEIIVQPPHFSESPAIPLAGLGLHALARFAQRGRPSDEAAWLHAISPIGKRYIEIAERGGDFEIEAANGVWKGSCMEIGAMRLLVIRTFVA